MEFTCGRIYCAGMCRGGIYLSEIYLKPKSSSKYLISLVIDVGVLYLLDLLAMFGLHRKMNLINHLKKIRNNDELYKRVKAAEKLAGFSFCVTPVYFLLSLGRLIELVFSCFLVFYFVLLQFGILF